MSGKQRKDAEWSVSGANRGAKEDYGTPGMSRRLKTRSFPFALYSISFLSTRFEKQSEVTSTYFYFRKIEIAALLTNYPYYYSPQPR